MDLAVYISELLGLQGEVSVPGIGYFVQTRINGYYNEQENKFYPPVHEVDFDPEPKKDEELAKYISSKKNISLASSKYFIDKYVAGLKQQLASNNVEIAGLGQLYINGSVLAFIADTSKGNDASFYGFTPIGITEHQEKPVTSYTPSVEEEVKPQQKPQPVKDAPVKPIEEKLPPSAPTVIEKTEEPEAEQEYEEPQRSSRGNTWIALLLIVIIALLTVMGLYKYKPEWFGLNEKPKTIYVIRSSDTTTAAADTDSAKTTANPDSVSNAAAQPVAAEQHTNPGDTVQRVHWEIIGGAFEAQKTAEIAIKSYQENGISAKITTDIPGKLTKISFGTYYSEQEAEKAKNDLLKTGKVDKGIYTLKINPKK